MKGLLEANVGESVVVEEDVVQHAAHDRYPPLGRGSPTSGLARAPPRGNWVGCRGFRATVPTPSHRLSADATFVSSSWPRI
eukprot:499833-Pleurochrysis_carterae.AAC.1